MEGRQEGTRKACEDQGGLKQRWRKVNCSGFWDIVFIFGRDFGREGINGDWKE